MSSLDMADLDKRAQSILAKADEVGWATWTEPSADAERCIVCIAPSRTEPATITAVWERDPASGKTIFLEAEGDGRDLPGPSAVLSFLMEEIERVG
jgi:hypothetical protein